MCKVCEEICKYIEETFGHIIPPKELGEFIEMHPVRCETCGQIDYSNITSIHEAEKEKEVIKENELSGSDKEDSAVNTKRIKFSLKG